MELDAIIRESGNGFPDVGDYVPGGITETTSLFRVLALRGPIHAGGHGGAPDWIRATVVEVDWEDCDAEDRFDASVEVSE